MVEPDRQNLLFGKRNFELNGFRGTFIQAGIGKEVLRHANSITVDAIRKENKLEFIDILHSDIQGFELEMLHGASQLFEENKVGYIFISTHSDQLHEACRQFLLERNFHEVADVPLQDSSSWDGVIVMRNPDYPGIEKVEVSKGVSTR